MSKTFKSAGNPCASISITPSADGVRTVHMHGIESTGVTVSTADAPALALAILEAAGVESAYRSAYNAGSDWQLEHSVNELSEYVRARSEYEAEAEAQAKLEADALELHQLFESLQSDDETVWLAVARRAREMRAEK